MIIGESPGREELREGVPFVGMSWKILKQTIETSGIPNPMLEVEPYVTNALHCWPGTNKKEATMNQAVMSCRNQLIDEINLAPRKLILVLGSFALRAVTGNVNKKITQERGSIITSQLDPRIKNVENAFTVVHPAFILRGGGNYRQFRGDIRYALELYNGGSPKRQVDVDYLVIETPEMLAKLVRRFKELPQDTAVAADIETGSPPSDPEGPGGFNHIDDAVISLGLAFREDAVYIIPEEPIGHSLTRRLFQLPNVRWVWHNGKFDVKFLRRAGIEEARVDEDTMLQSYTLDERGGVHSLDIVGHDWLDIPNWEEELKKYKKKKQSYRVIPKPVLYKYQALDVSATLRLYNVMKPMIDQDKHNANLYYNQLIPASEYLSRVEDRGLLVDFDKVNENMERLDKQAAELCEPIYEAALQFPDSGYDLKLPNSPTQLAKLLYDDLKFRTKTRSTSKEALEELPAGHPVIKALKAYRKVAKLNSTYVKPLKESVASDLAIHTVFKLHGTATGRLACGDPINLQNIPRDGDIRGQFVARPGYIFIEPDLSQAELRSLAAFSGDPLLCKIYNDPDAPGVHDTVRAQMYGNPADWSSLDIERYRQKWFITETDTDKQIKAILEEQKMRAKNVNFGIIYGITEYGLADQMECSYEEARQALKIWAQTFPVAWEFIQRCKSAPRKGQNLVTLFGNRKRHGVIAFENLQALENEAANFIHQATASHIMLRAGIQRWKYYRDTYDAWMVNIVHDSTLIECPDDYDTVVTVAKDFMDTLIRIPKELGIHRVPFVADAKVGKRWGRSSMISFDKYEKEYAHGSRAAAALRLQEEAKLAGATPFIVDYDRGHKRVRPA
jgi:DNA polymerase-1